MRFGVGVVSMCIHVMLPSCSPRSNSTAGTASHWGLGRDIRLCSVAAASPRDGKGAVGWEKGKLGLGGSDHTK